MIPDVAFVSLALSALIMAARFSRIFQALAAQLLAKDMMGPLRTTLRGTHPPQALPNSESAARAR